MTTLRSAAIAAALLISAAAGSALAATDTVAATAPATQPATLRAAQNDHDPNQLICKHEEVIGTRLGGHKTCHTRAGWEAIARDAGDAANAAQINANHFNPGCH